jgi:DNA adenine methylase
MNAKVHIPPIKSQGIKTKLVPWIKTIVPNDFKGVWIEPFMGTGIVAFNISPQHAVLCDTNPHLINFYTACANREITAEIVKAYLIREGEKLQTLGEEHYYFIRERFNNEYAPLDFLFLNRAGFNGMIRFNKKGGFNIPFCRKPQRFAKAYITKIVNQVDFVSRLLAIKKFTFKCQDFSQTIAEASANDIIYCDPPYIDRHADYYNGWCDENEKKLFSELSDFNGKFILSTWHHNDYRDNNYIQSLWSKFNILTREHFYHIGGKELNRNSMIEALITNFSSNGVNHKNTSLSNNYSYDLFQNLETCL